MLTIARRRRTRLVALSIASALVLAACTSSATGGATQSQGKPKSGGDLVIDGTQPITTLDKDLAATSNDGLRVIENVYDRLYVLDTQGRPEPSLATSYTESADHLTWTFKLRPGVVFSNGTPLTAKDVVFSLDLARKGLYLGSLYSAVASVAAPDTGTVVVTLNSPDPALLDKLTLFTAGVIPANYGGETKTAFWKKPVASGAWEIQSFTAGRVVKVVPNPRYWGAKPYLHSVTMSLVTDANTRLLQLLNGQAQLISTPSNSQLKQIRANPNSTVLISPSTEVDFLYLNTSKPPLNDVHLRRAISLAIDRKSLVQAALLGNGAPAATWLSKEVLGGYQPADGVRFDVAAAKQELAQSATPHGTKLTLTFATASGPALSTVAQVLQQDLKAIGIDLTLRSADANTVGQAITKKTFGMGFGLITYDIPDPGENVGYYLATNAFNSSDPASQVKALNAQGSSVTGTAARIDLYRSVANALVAQADTIGLYSVPYVWGAARRLHGLQQTITGQFSFSKLWLG